MFLSWAALFFSDLTTFAILFTSKNSIFVENLLISWKCLLQDNF